MCPRWRRRLADIAFQMVKQRWRNTHSRLSCAGIPRHSLATIATSDFEFEHLVTRFHKLPQGMQDIIRDYTFTVQHHGLVVNCGKSFCGLGAIHDSYKLPAILQVDHTSRARLRKLYLWAIDFASLIGRQRQCGLGPHARRWPCAAVKTIVALLFISCVRSRARLGAAQALIAWTTHFQPEALELVRFLKVRNEAEEGRVAGIAAKTAGGSSFDIYREFFTIAVHITRQTMDSHHEDAAITLEAISAQWPVVVTARDWNQG